MKYVVSYAGDGPNQAVMLMTESQEEVDAWVAKESDRPHKVIEADDLQHLAKLAGHPVIDFEAAVHFPKVELDSSGTLISTANDWQAEIRKVRMEAAVRRNEGPFVEGESSSPNATVMDAYFSASGSTMTFQHDFTSGPANPTTVFQQGQNPEDSSNGAVEELDSTPHDADYTDEQGEIPGYPTK